MNRDYPFLSKYAGFLLQYQLDELALEAIRRAREENLPILKQLSSFTEDQIFLISKKGFAEDILIPLTEGKPFDKVKEGIENWKANTLILSKDQISGSDITGIYHVRKLSMLEMLDDYEYTKTEGKKLHQEIENYFNTCINLGYHAYEEIQRGALKESQDILNGILSNMPVIVSRVDKEGNTTKSMGYGLRLLGLKDEDLVGTNIFKNYPNARNTQKAINGEKVTFQGTAKSNTGEQRYYQSYFFPEENGAIGFSIDVTEQKIAEEKLKENDYFITKIADATPIIIQVYDRINDVEVYSNKHLHEILGYSTEPISNMGKSIAQIVHADDMPKLLERNKQIEVMKDGDIIESEMKIKDAAGGYRWIFTRTTIFKRTPEGKVWQTLSTSIDVTDKKKTEEKLQQQLRIFDTALSNTVDFNFIFNLEGRFIYVNKPFLDLWGKTMEEVFGKNFKDLGYPDDLVRLHHSQITEVIETSLPVKGENTYINPQGRQGYYQYVFVPVFNESGHVEAIVGTMHDITELKKVAEKQYKKIFESTNDAILIYDQAGCLVEVNPAGYKMHGYSYQEMIGLNGKSLVIEEDHGKFSEFIKEVKDGKQYYANLRHRRKDGSLLYVQKTGTGFTYRGKPHLLAVVHDITEQKIAIDALKESEDRFRTMADNIPNLAWITNAEGVTIWYNKRWFDYTGMPSGQMDDSAWKSVTHPDSLPKVMEQWTKSLQMGELFEMILPLKGADGIFRSFLTRITPVSNSMGKIVRWFGTSTDVSEVEDKNKELIRINSELDNFIYTASHDLKAPVANIEGLVNTLIDDMPEEIKDNDNLQDILHLIQKSIERFKITILDLTEVSKTQKMSEEDMDNISCIEIIDNVRLTISDEIKKAGAQLVVDVSQCKTIPFSRKNFRSIVYNLLSNAVKYRDPQRPLVIYISSYEQEGYLVLSVRDNGLGISKTNQAKLFTMFKRFHDHVEGTGIGLYIVKKIIDNSGGKIEVHSEEGKGTTFKVYFKNKLEGRESK